MILTGVFARNPRLVGLYLKHSNRGRWDECWLWSGPVLPQGYGISSYRHQSSGRTILAHRLSYELHKGPIPDGLEIDHLCQVKACTNPGHLDAVTHAENIRRACKPGGNHPGAANSCPQGHAYEGDNLISTGDGKRRCRECHRAYNRVYRARKDAA